MPLRDRIVPIVLPALLTTAASGWVGTAGAADRAVMTVTVNVVSQCTVESRPVPGSPVPGSPDPRAALRATRVTCAATTPYDVTAARADRAPAPQTSWIAGPDGTILVTVAY